MSPRRVTVLLLLALFGWMAASVSDRFSPTADEIAHLTAGYSYLTANDYHLQPENGIFPQRWAALPLLLSAPNFPPADDPDRHLGQLMLVGYDFFYQRGNAPDVLLAEGRAMIALLGVATAALVYAWSRTLFGTAGGLVSLVLAGFARCCSRTPAWRRRTWRGRWASSWRCSPGGDCATGCRPAACSRPAGRSGCWRWPSSPACCSRRSRSCWRGRLRRAPLPVAAGQRRWRLGGGRRAAALAGGGLAAAALAVAVIWAAYGFRYTGARPAPRGPVLTPWDDVLMTRPATIVMDMADRLPSHELLNRQPGVCRPS